MAVAAYVTDPAKKYLRTIARRSRLDTRLALTYAGGPGHFNLRTLLKSYGPKTRNRFGARRDVGERAVCRAYLASLVHFVLERYGTTPLRKLFTAPDHAVAVRLAALVKTSVPALQRAWHQWLDKKTLGTSKP